jgi:chemotaxis protein CheX
MTAVTPDLDVIGEIMRMVWSSVIGDDLHDAEAVPTGIRVSGIVHISGTWNGSVQLSISQKAALRATSVLFDMEEADVTSAEIDDAVGELTNMVGGGLKSILPSPSNLSLPSVTTGENFALSVPGAHPVNEVRLDWAGEPLHVTIWAV